jgi:hypothetical protein
MGAAIAGAEQLEREVDLAEGHAAQAGAELLAGREAELALLRELALAPALALGARERDADADGYAGGDGSCDGAGERRDNGAMPGLPRAPWWTVRRASNRKPATYRCPFCGGHLAALSEHMLIAPEGDTRRRRHAHTECVLAARKRGQLMLRDEWLRTQPRSRSLWSRLLGRG